MIINFDDQEEFDRILQMRAEKMQEQNSFKKSIQSQSVKNLSDNQTKKKSAPKIRETSPEDSKPQPLSFWPSQQNQSQPQKKMEAKKFPETPSSDQSDGEIDWLNIPVKKDNEY